MATKNTKKMRGDKIQIGVCEKRNIRNDGLHTAQCRGFSAVYRLIGGLTGKEQGRNGRSDFAGYADGGVVFAEVCKRQIFGYLERAVYVESECRLD